MTLCFAFFACFRNTLVSPELCHSIDNFNRTLDSVLERHAPLCRCKVGADRLEPWYRDVQDELEAAIYKNHRCRAERQWVKAANTINKHIFNAAKRLVAKMVHKAKSLFLGNEIANATSSKQLFNVCGRLIGRKRSSPLPSLYPIHDLPDVFNNYFVQKVQSIRVDLDQQSMSPMSCRLTDQKVVSRLSSLYPITEVELKATIVISKPTSCSLDHLQHHSENFLMTSSQLL